MKHIHHIIKCVNGKRVRTDKTMSLTIKQHANIHKKYFKQWGFKEDYLAWQGLSGQMPKQKIISEIAKEMGKRNAHYMHTKQSIEKMRKTKIGSKLSKKHKEAISKGLIGHVVSKEQKQKTADSKSKEYIITYQGKTFEIKNLRAFAIKNKLDQGNLCKVAQKKINSHKGYMVSYK